MLISLVAVCAFLGGAFAALLFLLFLDWRTREKPKRETHRNIPAGFPDPSKIETRPHRLHG
jgi:hypothetical protein